MCSIRARALLTALVACLSLVIFFNLGRRVATRGGYQYQDRMDGTWSPYNKNQDNNAEQAVGAATVASNGCPLGRNQLRQPQ